MEPGERFVCHLEALPIERPEFCSGGICCGIYKKQSVLLILVLWSFVIIVIVLPILYCTLIYYGSKKILSYEDNDDDQQLEQETPSTEDVPLSVNKNQSRIQKINHKIQYNKQTKMDNPLGKPKKDADLSKKYANLPGSKTNSPKSDNSLKEENPMEIIEIPINKQQRYVTKDGRITPIKGEKDNDKKTPDNTNEISKTPKHKNAKLKPLRDNSSNIKEDYPFRNEIQSQEQQSVHNEKLSNSPEIDDDLNQIREGEGSFNKINNLPSIKTQTSDRKISESFKVDKPLKNQEMQTMKNGVNEKEIQTDEENRTREENKYKGNEKSTNTAVVLRNSKQTQANLKLREDFPNNNKNKYIEDDIPHKKVNLIKEISVEDESLQQQANNPVGETSTVKDTMEAKFPIQQYLERPDDSKSTGNWDEGNPRQQSKDEKEYVNTTDSRVEEAPKQHDEYGKEHVTVSDSMEEESPKQSSKEGKEYVTTTGSRDGEIPKQENHNGNDHKKKTGSRDSEIPNQQNEDRVFYTTTTGSRDEETSKEQNVNIKYHVKSTGSKDEKQLRQQDEHEKEHKTVLGSMNDETSKEQNYDEQYYVETTNSRNQEVLQQYDDDEIEHVAVPDGMEEESPKQHSEDEKEYVTTTGSTNDKNQRQQYKDE